MEKRSVKTSRRARRAFAYLEEYVCEMSKHIRREVLVEEADCWYKLFDTAREQR